MQLNKLSMEKAHFIRLHSSRAVHNVIPSRVMLEIPIKPPNYIPISGPRSNISRVILGQELFCQKNIRRHEIFAIRAWGGVASDAK